MPSIYFRPLVVSIIILCSLFPGSVAEIWGQEKGDIKQCKNMLSPIKVGQTEVTHLGGVWSRFEQSKSLRPESTTALKLDTRINNLVFTLSYLCETLNGVPLNDLAFYVNSLLKKMTLNETRSHLIGLGKAAEKVEIWLEFTQKALKIEKRKLDFISVKSTIGSAEKLVQTYINLFNQIPSVASAKTVQKATLKLTTQIEDLVASDPNLTLASGELAMVPYWDFDENHGGS